MCNRLCRRMINPSPKLEKILTFLRILILINLIVPVLKILIERADDLLNDLICVFILWGACESCNFLIAGFYIMIVMINNFTSFFLIGAYVQAIIQGAVLNNKHVLFLCVYTFIFLFYSFTIAIVFPAYKEMKAIFVESTSNLRRSNDMEENLGPGNYNNVSERNENLNQQVGNNQNFVPFSGRGVQLG